MRTLMDVYDSYGDFERAPYFTFCFDTLPSNLIFKTIIEESKAMMEAALEILTVSKQDVQIIFKHWKTKDHKDADSSKDYPYQYLLKSNAKKLLIWISLEHNELEVDFLYDDKDTELETWILETNHAFRTKFGTKRTPAFKVLSRDSHSFFTEDVKTEIFECDVAAMYNDDFIPIHKTIEASLNVDKAGLILLHGIPGTGKTSYIKSLINTYEHKSFIFIQNEFINELLHPDFISFLLKNQNSILIIEDAEKVLTSREQKNESSVVSTILQLTDGLFSDYLNIKIICTFNTSINKIDSALLRKGRMIAYYEFKALTKEKANSLLQASDHEPSEKALTLAEIFNYENKSFQQTQKRKIGF
jgi:SpoVK/Ycf46/Vps4 family AAA+-type ATPase